MIKSKLSDWIVVVGIVVSSLVLMLPIEAKEKVIEPAPVDAKLLRKVPCFVNPKARVSSEHVVAFKKAKLFFSSKSAAEKFKANPKSFAAAANHQLVLTQQYEIKVCPLSGEELDEDSVVIKVGGAKVPLLCGECAKDISKDTLPEQIELLFDEEAFETGKFTLRRAKKAKKPATR